MLRSLSYQQIITAIMMRNSIIPFVISDDAYLDQFSYGLLVMKCDNGKHWMQRDVIEP